MSDPRIMSEKKQAGCPRARRRGHSCRADDDGKPRSRSLSAAGDPRRSSRASSCAGRGPTRRGRRSTSATERSRSRPACPRAARASPDPARPVQATEGAKERGIVAPRMCRSPRCSPISSKRPAPDGTPPTRRKRATRLCRPASEPCRYFGGKVLKDLTTAECTLYIEWRTSLRTRGIAEGAPDAPLAKVASARRTCLSCARRFASTPYGARTRLAPERPCSESRPRSDPLAAAVGGRPHPLGDPRSDLGSRDGHLDGRDRNRSDGVTVTGTSCVRATRC